MQAYKSVNIEEGELHSAKDKMTQIANNFGVSINLIEMEVKKKITEEYSK